MTEAGEAGRCEWCEGKGWLFNDGTLGYDPCICNPAPPRQSPPDEESRLRAELTALRAQRDQMGAALRDLVDVAGVVIGTLVSEDWNAAGPTLAPLINSTARAIAALALIAPPREE